MGIRQDRLEIILRDLGYQPTGTASPSPTIKSLPPSLRIPIIDLYHRLGGILDTPRLRTGKWDIALQGLLVELDEHQHFHRYRATALKPKWAQDLPWRCDYIAQCAKYESVYTAERRIGFWTNPSAEKMFGAAGPLGDIEGPGAPRGRQRACYDAMKDILAARGVIRLARLSVYDEVGGGALLGRALEGKATLDRDELHALLIRRTVPQAMDHPLL
ncbi:hypothetical protein AB4Z42_17140 [Mycobacterium sp. 2YAF39]|uniref:DUF7255 family protein n=1 Tax=Mycobacterium sp. 2YAF39 TaxID=3233033 RepID=UPI003F9B33D6